MAYIEGRVQSSSSGNGLAYASIRDNFNNYGNCDVYGLFYSYYAYFPGYQITASAGGYTSATHEITAAEWSNKFMTIRLVQKPPTTGCCFTADTKVLMADGSSRTIDSIRPGDRVLGPRGTAPRVIAIENPELGGRELYSLNGGAPFVTSEHPFSTSQGWKSVDSLATQRERPNTPIATLRVGDELIRRVGAGDATISGSGNLAPVLEAAPELETVTLRSVFGVIGHSAMTVYNLVLADGHEYFANSFLVHNKGGW